VLQNIHFEGNYPFKTKSLHSVAILETPWEAISKQQHWLNQYYYFGTRQSVCATDERQVPGTLFF